MDGTSFIGIFITVLVLYFIPFIIALLRRKTNTVAIFFLNLLAGWTFFGWLLAFIWSLTKDHNAVLKS